MANLEELIRNNQPIYVYNRTGRFVTKQGVYVLEVRHEGKRTHQVHIPPTKYPFHLSAMVPADLLAKSTELFDAISKGVLELADPADARKVLEDPIAKKAQEHAMRQFQPTRRSEATAPQLVRYDKNPDRSDGKPNTSVIDDASDTKNVNPELRLADAVADDVNVNVQAIVDAINSAPELKEEKYLELVALSDLKENDYGYVLANIDYSRIKQWARSELAAMVGEERAAEIEADTTGEDEEEFGLQTTRPRKRRKHR